MPNPASEAAPTLENLLRELLACPACYGELRQEPERLVCAACHRAYPVQDGIPVLIAQRAVR